MVYTGSHASSFRQASEDLKEEAEVEISEQRIMRATERIGQERVAEREAEVGAWERLSLPEQLSSPRAQVPSVAVVEMDGGRMQIRDARRLPEGWPIYCQWAQWLWSGRVEMVIAALRQRQQEVGLPETSEPEDTPRAKVAAALRYLENQQSRMKYDQYRREGLPITSSHIESTMKQINRRVKGSEKFWSDQGAESLLQLAADYLSETQPLTTFWRTRPTRATGQRHYQSAT